MQKRSSPLLLLMFTLLCGCTTSTAPLASNAVSAQKAGATTPDIAPTPTDTPTELHAKSESEPELKRLGAILAGIYAQNGRDWHNAAYYLAIAASANPDNALLGQNAFIASIAAGDIDNAAKLAPKFLNAADNGDLARAVLATNALEQGDYAKVIALYANDTNPALADIIRPFFRAWALAGQKKPRDAIAVLNASPQKDTLNPLFALHEGMILAANDQPDKATLAFARTHGDAAASLRSTLIAGAFYERNHQPDKARTLYQATTRNLPESVTIDAALQRLNSGKTLPAEDFSSQIRAGMAESLFGIAFALQSQNAADYALLYARMAAHLAPDSGFIHLMLGAFLSEQGNLDAALAEYALIPATDPLAWVGQLHSAEILLVQKKTAEAEQRVRPLLKQFPHRADAAILRGDIARTAQQWPDAVRAYDMAIARLGDKAGWEIYYARAIAHERGGNWQKAEADLRTALKQQPDEPALLNYLAYSWVDAGVKLDEAEKMLTKALAKNPSDPAIIDSMGWLRYRQGRYAEALKYIEEAIIMLPGDAVVNDHLGDVYAKLGRHREAGFQWQRALEILATAPDAKLETALRAKLKSGL